MKITAKERRGQRVFFHVIDEATGFDKWLGYDDLAPLMKSKNGQAACYKIGRLGWDSPDLWRDNSYKSGSRKDVGNAAWQALSGDDRSYKLGEFGY